MKKPKPILEKTKRDDGFTLIEILVAIVILATAILGIMALFPSSYRQITNSSRMSAINHLGRQKVDQLRATYFDDKDLADGLHPSTGASPPETFPERVSYTNEWGNVYSDYSIEWVVDDGSPQADMKTITVTVGYGLYDSSGNPTSNVQDQYSATFETYVSR